MNAILPESLACCPHSGTLQPFREHGREREQSAEGRARLVGQRAHAERARRKGHKEEEAAGEGGDAGPSALSDAGARLDAGGEGGGAHETATHGAQPVHHERSGLAREFPALEEPCGREEAGPCWYVGAGSSIFETGVKRAKSL